MKLYAAAAAVGFLLDLLFGDPHSMPHPVRTLGTLIGKSEQWFRRIFPGGKSGELAGGLFFALFILSACGAAGWILLLGAEALGGEAGKFFLACIMSYYLLAARSLKDESMKVYASLKEGKTEEARFNVSMIVGRDTKRLDQEGIARAAVETVAENTSDGVIAPMFYLFLGGPLAGWMYKAVNTMDSMVGYKNDKYLYFGRAAARLDDLANLIPARLSALLMILSAFLLRMDAKGAWNIWLRDRYNHKSPNSAQTEAACAGALGVRLAGDAWYFGKLCRKPFIGDGKRNIEYEDIPRANRLMYTTAVLMMLAGLTAVFLIQ
ncbi:adenosylcobinamide-phosphate synthase [[Clostridium] cf. saccharolyticum K10]|uniref:adenosylcobinamide-phosphate synthase CbiB n=1 Tax=Clostridium sp. AM29-11AC TaxID=2293028 RepID=UPI0001CCD901|nr:adenosylcobinamide-phosphate synthase CbiB [Clostridium sp. AM29-11AC]CBK77808.1 adenosylcobinamide-phosphate synthase [[Clostridium] cf. saccharolyticum K10]